MRDERAKVFEELENIYEYRHQYSIEWAFKDAQEKIDKMHKIIRMESNSDEIDYKDRLDYEISSEALKRNRWYSNIFQKVFSFVTVLEFLASVLLVLFVSELSHQGEVFISSQLFSLSVVIVFAFIKVFLEQYFIRPKIELLGWSMYQKTVNTLKEITSQLN